MKLSAAKFLLTLPIGTMTNISIKLSKPLVISAKALLKLLDLASQWLRPLVNDFRS